MHRILNCPIYCITSLFIIWQQCDPGLKDLLVKKIMCFPFSVLLKCQVLHFWHLLKNKMSSEIFFPSTEVTSEELGMAGLFSTFSPAQKFRHISFPQKLPIYVSLCVLTEKKMSFISLCFFTDNSFLSLFIFSPLPKWLTFMLVSGSGQETGRMRGHCLPASSATSLHPQHPCPAKFWPPHHPCWECTPQTGRVLAKFSSGTNVKPSLWGRCVSSVTAVAPPGLALREQEYVLQLESAGVHHCFPGFQCGKKQHDFASHLFQLPVLPREWSLLDMFSSADI